MIVGNNRWLDETLGCRVIPRTLLDFLWETRDDLSRYDSFRRVDAEGRSLMGGLGCPTWRMHGRCIIGGCTWRSSRGCCNCRVPPHAGTVALVESSRSEGDKTVHRKKREREREAPPRRRDDLGVCSLERIPSGFRARFRRLGFLLHKGGESIEGRSIEERRWTTGARAFLDLFSSSIFFRPRVVRVSLRFGGALTRRKKERERDDGRGRGFEWGPRPPPHLLVRLHGP